MKVLRIAQIASALLLLFAAACFAQSKAAHAKSGQGGVVPKNVSTGPPITAASTATTTHLSLKFIEAM
jgi:hypothetical protein